MAGVKAKISGKNASFMIPFILQALSLSRNPPASYQTAVFRKF
jgi:hypothetical protein